MHVQDGIAHVARPASSDYDLLDVSDPASPRWLGTAAIPAAHNVWPTRDNNFAVTSSETTGGSLTLLDISNPRLPQRLGTWRTGAASSIPHNAFVRDRVVHASWYREGYRALDLSNPDAPVEVALYDESTGSGYSGTWGCYPFQPSGVVYLSDMQRGLLIVETPATPRQYGTATAGAGGSLPSIHTHGSAYLGNDRFAVELEGAPPDADVLLLLGAAPRTQGASGPLPILIDLGRPVGPLRGLTDSRGRASVPLPVPPGAPTGSIYGQFVVAERIGAATTLAATSGLEIDVFAH
ncbi:MAG: hypothetical protein AAF628_32040 [Planctomycetota bacterium]